MNNTSKTTPRTQIAILREQVEHMAIEIAKLRDSVQTLTNKVFAPPPLKLALIGSGMHGLKSIKSILKLKDCRLSYVCDVDSKRGKARAAEIKAIAGYSPKVVTDFRDALKDSTIDAVIICTPHHWHALAAVWALAAGKHVYVEKPVTHCFYEGPALLRAAQQSGKIAMPGTQLRSNTSLLAAGEYMRSGKLGPISLVHCVIHKDRPPLPFSPNMPIPSTVNYDLWLGPRPDRPLTRSKFHYHWHWFWDFGNGALGNNGIHRIDAARLALDLKGRSEMVLSVGGRFGTKDATETPNTQLCLYRYGQTWIMQDILGVRPEKYRGKENAVIFHGSEGVIVYEASKATLCKPDFTPISEFEGGQASHYEVFLKAIRSNFLSESFNALEEAVTSSDLCHFGNIAHRIGTEVDDKTILTEFQRLGVPNLVYERFEAMRSNIRAAGDGDAPLSMGSLCLQEGPMPLRDAPAAAIALLATEERPPFALL